MIFWEEQSSPKSKTKLKWTLIFYQTKLYFGCKSLFVGCSVCLQMEERRDNDAPRSVCYPQLYFQLWTARVWSYEIVIALRMFQAVCDASVDNGSASAPTLDIHCDTSGTQPQSRGEEGRWHGDHCTAPLLPTHLHIPAIQQTSGQQAASNSGPVFLFTNQSFPWMIRYRRNLHKDVWYTSYQFFCACDIIPASVYPFSTGCYWPSIVCYCGHCKLQQMDAWPAHWLGGATRAE